MNSTPSLEAAPVADPRRFALAGNATFTVVSKKTETRFTYRVQAPKLDREGNPVGKEQADVRFVSVLTGSCNESSYTYVGNIFLKDRNGQPCLTFLPGKKSPINRDAPSVKAFDWTFRVVLAGPGSDLAEIHHSGTCGRCGRKLTVPESIETGLGPECAGKVGF